MALHDPLTGLTNRLQFQNRFEGEIADAARRKSGFALASIDLDWFKPINDTLGHDVGDKVLVAVARRLTTILRRDDTAARFGGDEFVLLLREARNRADAELAVRKIVEGFRTPLDAEGVPIDLTVSIGVAVYPEDGTELEGLLKKSDSALYEVKSRGRNGYAFYLYIRFLRSSTKATRPAVRMPTPPTIHPPKEALPSVPEGSGDGPPLGAGVAVPAGLGSGPGEDSGSGVAVGGSVVPGSGVAVAPVAEVGSTVGVAPVAEVGPAVGVAPVAEVGPAVGVDPAVGVGPVVGVAPAVVGTGVDVAPGVVVLVNRNVPFSP